MAMVRRGGFGGAKPGNYAGNPQAGNGFNTPKAALNLLRQHQPI